MFITVKSRPTGEASTIFATGSSYTPSIHIVWWLCVKRHLHYVIILLHRCFYDNNMNKPKKNRYYIYHNFEDIKSKLNMIDVVVTCQFFLKLVAYIGVRTEVRIVWWLGAKGCQYGCHMWAYHVFQSIYTRWPSRRNFHGLKACSYFSKQIYVYMKTNCHHCQKK
jgi:hypothetical protein